MVWTTRAYDGPLSPEERKIELLLRAADSLQEMEDRDMNNALAMEIWAFLDSLGIARP